MNLNKYIYRKLRIDDKKFNGSIESFYQNVVVPIFVKRDKQYFLIGTGFILGHRKDHFLISANHVVKDNGKEFYTHDKGRFVNITGTLNQPVIINENKVLKDLIDIDFCTIKLSDNFLQELVHLPIIFDHSLVYSKDDFKEGDSLIVAGYLISKTEFVLKLRRLKSSIFVHQLDFVKNELGYYNYYIPIKRSDGSSLPELNGLSGSPIFYIPKDSKDIFIAGIGKAYRVDKIATRIDIFFEPMSLVLKFIESDGV
ncbi:hypothetical protein LFX25_19680 [Leptospira sp. FAT2]|uniref:hypothetical protein n=1 Tax=Leptospira sanjuanensis TaxID=2879643 RepID=UPI001EE8BAFF|nr:hypothetical protein [Leptospira sanjuanensis]MCG6170127.1 hypothetical protein [Leptospira sanjuanensis]MCG6195466.1 hypothetical protein [Leptospira sanjuanensis]